MSDQAAINWFEAPEWVALAGPPPVVTTKGTPLADWENVVGTGPWILSDFVVNSSITYDRNPEYWGNDPLYDSARNGFWNSANEEEAARALVKADKRSAEQHFGVFMVHDPGYVAWQPYLKGYSGEVRFWSQQIMWSRLWVDKAMKKSMGR